MRKLLITLLALFFLAVNSKAGEPVYGAKIYIETTLEEDPVETIMTNNLGFFSSKPLPEGNYIITVDQKELSVFTKGIKVKAKKNKLPLAIFHDRKENVMFQFDGCFFDLAFQCDRVRKGGVKGAFMVVKSKPKRIEIAQIKIDQDGVIAGELQIEGEARFKECEAQNGFKKVKVEDKKKKKSTKE